MFLLLGLLIAAPMPANAGLSDQDRADIARVEDYLSRLTTLQSKFIQIASNGNMAEGMLYLSRPGRMRFEYAPPTPVRMIADGTWLIFQDLELEQVSHLPLSSSPLGILVNEDVRIEENLEILQIHRDPGVLRLRLRMRDEPDAGEVQLIFADRPLILRQWVVTDAQGVQIRISLQDTIYGIELPDELFRLEVKEGDEQHR